MMKPLLILVISFCLISIGCNLNPDEVLNKCSNQSLEELKKQNTLSEDCKKAIQDLLPGVESNLNNNLIKIGIAIGSAFDTVYFSISDLSGNPESIDTGNIKISSWNQGVEKDISKNIIWFKSNLTYSLSIVVDYSGSMSDEDIKDAYSILNNFLVVEKFINGCEADHIIFSESVTEKSKFVSGNEMLKSILKIDTSYERESTSLYDAIGFGLESLSVRTRPAKILVVFTDGGENSSQKFTVDKIINLANENNVTLILIGSLFSDLDAFKNISTKTKGIYLYNKNISSLNDPLLKVSKILTEVNSFKVENNLLGDSLVVSYKGKSINYKIK